MILSFDEFLTEHNTSLDIFIDRWMEDIRHSGYSPPGEAHNMNNPQAIRGFGDIHEIHAFYNINLEYIINNAFVWERTPEGHRFWEKVAIAWTSFFDHNDLRDTNFAVRKQFGEDAFTSAIAKDAHLEFDENIV